jgi:hypothetical protein
MGRVRLALGGLFLVLVLAACSGSTPSASEGGGGGAASSPAAPSESASPLASMPASVPPTAPPSAKPSVSPSEAMASEPAATAEVTAAPTAIKPCELVPASEASQLAGVKYGKGQTSTFSGNGKICTYTSSALNVFSVVVAQAPDQAAVDAAESQVVGQLKSKIGASVDIQQLPDFADGAAIATAKTKVAGQTINVIGFYALKGTTFFAFSNVSLGNGGPSKADMQAEAQTVLGRIP